MALSLYNVAAALNSSLRGNASNVKVAETIMLASGKGGNVVASADLLH